LPAKRELSEVTEKDMSEALEALRNQRATFLKVETPAQEGEFVVVNYTGTSEGKPLTDFAPTARGLTEQKNFWIELKKDAFIPGFAEQLAGVNAGDKKTIEVEFPTDFVTPQLVGKKGQFEVEVVEVKQRILPEMDDALAKMYGAEDMEALRHGVRSDLQNELNLKKKRSIRNQLVHNLLSQIQTDLPESFVQSETRNVVYDLVSDFQRQGAPKEAIDQQKEEIYAMANRNAKERVKLHFVFQRIAEKEGIRVTPEELNARIVLMARNNKMAPDKFVKELEKHNGVEQIHAQVLHEKVIDYLQEHAKIEDVAPAPASQA